MVRNRPPRSLVWTHKSGRNRREEREHNMSNDPIIIIVQFFELICDSF